MNAPFPAGHRQRIGWRVLAEPLRWHDQAVGWLGEADMGGSYAAGMANKGLPFVLDTGLHDYMISHAESLRSPKRSKSPAASGCWPMVWGTQRGTE